MEEGRADRGLPAASPPGIAVRQTAESVAFGSRHLNLSRQSSERNGRQPDE
jgi:hypothetical protein